MRCVLARSITISGFSADLDPNASQPSAGNVHVMTGQAGDALGSGVVEGHRIYFRAIDGSNADVQTVTVNFTSWVRDTGASAALGRDAWVSIDPETSAAVCRMFESTLKGDLFVQVTAIGGTLGSAVTLQLYVEESTSVSG